MIKFAHLYENYKKLSDYLNDINFVYSSTCLIKIFTTHLSSEESVDLARYIKSIIPNSKIVGATSSTAIIVDGAQYTNSTLILIEVYEKLKIKVETFSFQDVSPKSLAREVHSTFCPQGEKEDAIVHILFSDLYPDIQQFVEEINEISPVLKLAGGLVLYDYVQNQAGFIFTEESIIPNGAIAFTATSDNVFSFIKTSSSIEPISEIYTITDTENHTIKSIENESAIEWMRKFLKINIDKEYSQADWETKANQDFLIHFPLMIKDMTGAGRFTNYEKETDSLSLYFSKLEKYTQFRVGYVNPKKTIKETYELCSEILDIPIESIFIYSCIFRKIYLENCAKWEITPFKNHNVCGLFMGGEIAFADTKNLFHNGSFVFTSVAEQETFIIPETAALENISSICDDVSFFEKFQKKGKDYLDSKVSLIKAISNAERRLNENIDKNFGIYNFYQYEIDRKKKYNGNICVLEILTADAHIAFIGQDKYYLACREMLKELSDYLKEFNLVLYSINHKNFLIACKYELNDRAFVSIVKKAYKKFEYTTIKNIDMTIVSRFVVVVNQNNKINKALSLLLSVNNIQDNFLISMSEEEDDVRYGDDTRMIDIITHAVKNNMVIPYYQGIYNNKTNKIDKYEALMRVIDKDGIVYSPAAFMDIARRYKLYNKCSMSLIKKALNDFLYRDQAVSINIALDDIQSNSFRSWFISLITGYPKANNIIIEFVENENYSKSEFLHDFVKNIRKYGVKIAIDDFGSGYSNFSTILALKPDFIKIDGSIIKNIFQDENNILMLDTISYLARKMHSQIVAEFVENEEIQNFIISREIEFSQGYHFSQPNPIDKLIQ